MLSFKIQPSPPAPPRPSPPESHSLHGHPTQCCSGLPCSVSSPPTSSPLRVHPSSSRTMTPTRPWYPRRTSLRARTRRITPTSSVVCWRLGRADVLPVTESATIQPEGQYNSFSLRALLDAFFVLVIRFPFLGTCMLNTKSIFHRCCPADGSCCQGSGKTIHDPLDSIRP